MDKGTAKNSIGRILESLAGNAVLVTIDGIQLARKGVAADFDYTSWPYVSLFSGTGKACRLYWQVPGGYDPALTVGPLELLLGDLVVSGPGYWFKRLLAEPADSLDLDSLPAEVQNSVPMRLGALKVGTGDVQEALEALRTLLPELKAVQTAPGLMLLKLPADRETMLEWQETILALLSEELMLDPLLIHGEAVLTLEMLHPYADALERLCDRLYARGGRGLQSLISHLPELAVGSLVPDPLPVIRDQGRLIGPVLKDSDLLQTAEVFIQSHLSISETSQSLFLHRNTLVYRLGKIEKLTGLDLKRMDHAMAFTLLKAAGEGAGSVIRKG